MEQTNYIVIFIADYPCGHRHPLEISTTACNGLEAIDKASACLTDDKIKSTNHRLFSVTPSDFVEAHSTCGPSDCKGAK